MTRGNTIAVVGGATAIGAMLLFHRHAFAASRNSDDPFRIRFGRPVPLATLAIVSSGWGRWRGQRLHRALDLPLAVGTPVLAIDRGFVVRVQPEDRGDAGLWVGVLHPSGITSRYLHLSRIDVRPGQLVERGQVLGASGDTGNSAGPHLHLDLRAPRYVLDWIEDQIGRPRGGWGPDLEPYGYSIPGEPWIPVDGYQPRVRREAAAYRVPLLRREVPS